MIISYGQSIKSNNLRLEELGEVIKMIKEDPSLKEKTKELRLLQTDEERRDYKVNNFSYICLGRFKGNIRRKDNLIGTEGMILDIDGIEGDQLQDLRERIKHDAEVLFSFISPGGRGLKVAVEFDREITGAEEYDQVYRSYATIFSLRYGIEVDTQTSDCSRACFLTSDEEVFVNQAPKRINVDEWLIIHGQLNSEGVGNEVTSDPKDNLSSAVEFLIQKNNETGAIYNDYPKWQLLGLALASLGEDGREHFLNLSLSNKKYTDTEESVIAEFDKLLKYFGQTSKQPVGIGTLFYAAQQHGFKIPKSAVPDQTAAPEPAAPPEAPSQPKTLKDRLQDIAAVGLETEKEIALKALANQLGVSIKTLKADLKAVTEEIAGKELSQENIILAHPSCDIRENFLILDFRETVIIENQPRERNLFLVADREKYCLVEEAFLRLNGTRIIFDTRGRELIDINERWSRQGLDQFLAAPVPPERLYERIKGALREYIDFQKPEYYGIVAAWIIASYFHRVFYATPYLFFFGKKGTAKSRGLEILERLAFNAIKIKGSSVASFIDTVDGIRGAFLTDQAESLSDPRNSEITGYHADSYTIGGGKRRIVQIVTGVRKILTFESYGPKAYAAQRDLDYDLRHRCITITMLKAGRDYPYPAPHLPIWAELRNDLYRLLLTKWKEVQRIYPQTGNDVSLRIRELWRPLETVLILENADSAKIEKIKNVFLDLMLISQDELSEKEIVLLESLLKLIEPKKADPKGISLSPSDLGTEMETIAKTMGIDLGFDKTKGLHTWIGFAIKRLSLFSQADTNSAIKRKQYIFHFNHIQDIYNRYRLKKLGNNPTVKPKNTDDRTISDPIKEFLEGNFKDIFNIDLGGGEPEK